MKNQKMIISKQNKTLRVLLKKRPQGQQPNSDNKQMATEWPCLSIH